jgi:hypothetical protein
MEHTSEIPVQIGYENYESFKKSLRLNRENNSIFTKTPGRCLRGVFKAPKPLKRPKMAQVLHSKTLI